MTITLNGLDVGNVQDISENRQTEIMTMAMPGMGSEGTFGMGGMGVTNEISFNGVKTGTFAELKTFADTMRTLCDGMQMTGVEFISDITGTITVMVKGFNFKWGVDPTQYSISYTMQIVQVM